ncbi:MAG: YeeE/YedE family protein [Minwuia sp.]|uniref:YeeE/YedE family protein n=1 Tax=Minwuia sp. TaxID=2493630 RepID=UPI003A86F894
MELELPILMALCGFALGTVAGLAARGADFCTYRAIEDWFLVGDTARLRTWALAVAVAMIAVQAMFAADIARIGESFYLAPSLGWGGAIAGGLLFGWGMAMVGTCGFGILVRLGSGDMRAVLMVLVMGLSAYMAARGLTALARVNLLEPLRLDLGGAGGQGLGHVIGAATGLSPGGTGLFLGLAIGAALILWCLSDRRFRQSGYGVASGLAVGVAVAGGFAATGILGNDDFDPQRVESLTYVLPPGETIMYLLTFTGAEITFGIGATLGTVFGAFLTTSTRMNFRFEAYDDAREMRRHVVGAFLMGFGGVAALGCTVGQGVSAMSTLSLGAPLAMASIVAGSVLGIRYLTTGSLLGSAEQGREP